MKKRRSRDIIIFIIIIPLFLIAVFFLSQRVGNRLPRFSVINKDKPGLSVYYEALQEMGYPVEMTYDAVDSIPAKELQVAAKSKYFDLYSEEVMNWVGGGGTLVYIDDSAYTIIDYAGAPDYIDGIPVYKYLEGKIIVADGNKICNIAIKNNKDYGYNLLVILQKNLKSKLYFNEGYLYIDRGKASLWDAIPTVYKFLIYQFVIGLLTFIYFKSKRFGKPIPYYEEVERAENEYLYSAAALYKATGAWELMVDSYYESFLKRIKGNRDNWLELWEEKELPALDRAKELFALINSNKKLNKRECVKVINTIDYLRRLYDKRSESKWKALKKI